MDRPDAGPPRRAGARARGRHVPDARRGRATSSSTAAGCAATRARSRASTRSCCWTSSARSAGSTGSRAACRSRPPGRRPTPSASTARRPRAGCAATSPRAQGRMLLELGIEAVWAAQPEDLSLLHVLFYIHSAGSLEPLFDTERRRAAGPLRRRLAADRAAAGRGARRARSSSARPCAASSTVGDGVTVHADGARRTRQARARGDRADARRPRRLRPAAARLPGPAHPAHADGHGRQVHGRLRGALLARRGALGPGHERHRAGQGDLRQLAAGRLAGRPARLPRGQARARARARSRG